MTAISEHTVNNSSYLIADGSVILPDDDSKYQDTDDSMSESDSDDEIEETERYMFDSILTYNFCRCCLFIYLQCPQLAQQC